MAKWLMSTSAAGDPKLSLTLLTDQYKMRPKLLYSNFPNIELDGLILTQQFQIAGGNWSSVTETVRPISVVDNHWNAIALSNKLTPGNWQVRARLGLRPWSDPVPFTLTTWTPSLLTTSAWWEPGQSLLASALKKPDGTTAATANNDPVGVLPDLAASNYNLTSLTTSNADTTVPKLQGVGTTPVIRWDGVNDVLRKATALGSFNAGAASWFFAIKSAPTAYGVLAGEFSSSSGAPWYSPGSECRSSAPFSTAMAAYRNDASGVTGPFQADVQAGVFDGNPHVFGCVDTGSVLTPWLDGVKGTSIAYTRAGTLTPTLFALGSRLAAGTASQPLPLDLYGAVLVNSAISEADAGNLSTYLGNLQGRDI